MINFTKLLFLAPLFVFQLAKAQDTLPIPFDIQLAYGNKTRSHTGEPGENYWQNHADYRISVYLNTAEKTITGSGTIVYSNKSPDTLDLLVVRLYQDLYKKGAPRDFTVSAADVHDGVAISGIKIDGSPFNPEDAERNGTNMILPLRPVLPPGEQVEVEISWSYSITQHSRIREGYYGGNNFFIGYWYPQIAVYDDVWGWNAFSFTGMQEFYNDFNNYRVEISAPEGYVVWATGMFLNPEENFAPPVLEKYEKARQSSEVMAVIEKADYENGPVTVEKDTLTWIYEAENVTDFSFAASNRYLWDASMLSLGDHETLVGAAYDEHSLDFYEVADIARQSLEYFSDEMPGVDYPYPAITVFNGGGGMEFPMMVNDGSQTEWWSTVHLTTHEIAHMYFPFYMGVNEQLFAFMDEGWAMMLPFGLQERLAPDYNPVSRSVRYYEDYAISVLESPLMLPTIALGGNVYRDAYRNSAYYKSGIAYHFLQEALGQELFLEAMHEYMDRWNGKHPLPYDFFFTFNEVAGEDLSWFWKPWFFETGYPDLEIQEVNTATRAVVIRNAGSIPTPVALEVIFSDDSVMNIRKSAQVWQDGGQTIEMAINGSKAIMSVRLGDATIPDVNRQNNHWQQ